MSHMVHELRCRKCNKVTDTRISFGHPVKGFHWNWQCDCGVENVEYIPEYFCIYDFKPQPLCLICNRHHKPVEDENEGPNIVVIGPVNNIKEEI